MGRRDRLVTVECIFCIGFGLGTATLVVLEDKANREIVSDREAARGRGSMRGRDEGSWENCKT